MRVRENDRIRQRAVRASAILVALLIAGTIGYRLVEGWPWFDALYMTVITLSTIGYGETHELSQPGRAFTIGLVAVGVGNIAYAFGATTDFFVAGGWEAYRRRARMERTLGQISGHTLICGYGRLGSAVADGLRQGGGAFVVVERDPRAAERLAELGIPHVLGDAGDDDVLLAAGIQRARALVAALNDDASNVFLTLTARVLHPGIVIYGKADDPHSLLKLERAGADHQFSPALVAGHQVAWQILRPAVTGLVDLVPGASAYEATIEEVRAADLEPGVGRPLQQTALFQAADLVVLAVRTTDAGVIFPPRPDHVLRPDDVVVVMARAEALARVRSA